MGKLTVLQNTRRTLKKVDLEPMSAPEQNIPVPPCETNQWLHPVQVEQIQKRAVQIRNPVTGKKIAWHPGFGEAKTIHPSQQEPRRTHQPSEQNNVAILFENWEFIPEDQRKHVW